MKRSSQVALLLMGVTGVGAVGYATMPTRECIQQTPAAPTAVTPGAPGAVLPGPAVAPAAPGATPAPKQAQPCSPRRSTWTHTRHNSHWTSPIFGRRTTDTTGRTSVTPGFTGTRTTTPGTTTTTTTRGGFGTTTRTVTTHVSS